MEEQTEADPLVVSHQLLVLLVDGGLDAGVADEGLRARVPLLPDGESGMDPAEGVEHVLRYVFGVDAVYGVADVLARRHDQAEGDQDQDRDRVVEAEDGRVGVDVVDADEGL